MSSIKKPAARQIIEKNVAFAMGAGLVPIPLLDLGALITIQITLVQSLAKEYHIESDRRTLRKVIVPLLKSPGISTWAVGGLGSLAKCIPGFGSLAGAGTMAILIGALTYATGRVFALHFERGGTLDDFNIRAQRKIFAKEFNSGKHIIRQINPVSHSETNSEDPFANLPIYLILKPNLGTNGKVYLKTYCQGTRPEKYIGTVTALQERYKTTDLQSREDAIIQDYRDAFIEHIREKCQPQENPTPVG